MKRRRSRKASPSALPGAEEIDRLYGLEPVFEPEQSPEHITALQGVSVQCPCCGESIHTRVDLSSGEVRYVEDCQVCCQPMELTIERNEWGALTALTARRMD